LGFVADDNKKKKFESLDAFKYTKANTIPDLSKTAPTIQGVNMSTSSVNLSSERVPKNTSFGISNNDNHVKAKEGTNLVDMMK